MDDPDASVVVDGIRAAETRDLFGKPGTVLIWIILDKTPPRINITSPINGWVTTDSILTVRGIIDDLVVGTPESSPGYS